MPESVAPRAFISYKWESRKVEEWVERFAHDLRRNGVDAYLDKREVDYGDSFIKYMTRNISLAEGAAFKQCTPCLGKHLGTLRNYETR